MSYERRGSPGNLEQRQMVPKFWPHKGASPAAQAKALQAARQKNASRLAPPPKKPKR